MRDSTIARNYAEALLSLARKADDLSGWGTMITEVGAAMEGDETLRRFLESPRVAASRKSEMLGVALQDRMPRLFVRFLQTLVRNRRQMLIPAIALEYRNLLDEVEGRLHAAVTVFAEPSEKDRDALAQQLSRAMGRAVVPHLTVNPAILGGVVVRVGDRVMDGSVRRRLAILRNKMVGR